MKILISGYYGFENTGDDAVLECIVAGLKEKGIDDITVLSNAPYVTSSKYGVKSINRNSFKDIFNAIKNADVIISGGGSLIQDVTSSKSLWYYLSIIFLGILLRKKVYIVGQGIGPIQRRYNKVLASFLLKRVDMITVRDEDSLSILKELNIEKNAILAADPVVNLNVCSDERIEKILQEEGIDKNRYIVVCTREWGNNELSRVELAKAVDAISTKYNLEVVFLPFYYKKDELESEKVANYLKSSYKIIRGKYEPSEVLGIIKNCSLLIGVRLHSLIFALAALVPFIGISYDPKIDGFLNSVNLKIFKIDKFSSDEIVKYAESILNNRDDFTENLKKHLKVLRELSNNNFVYLKNNDNEV
ncbi:MAG: polysaccharide pyruvyl transferase CsaB [Thermoanaerobacterium sp.]|nr:polysaccharide pyruvyl transferase CsaB [Thermoanaerobacterium sp.]